MSALAVRAPAQRLLRAGQALAAGAESVGGKAVGLARLELAGERVPPWFAVPAEAFAAHLARGGGAEGRDPARIAERIRATPLDPGLRAAVRAGLAGIGPGPWAVRSSVAGEDSESASHAGQYDSFLHLRSPEEVEDAVRRSWASAFSPRAVAYRRRLGLPPVLRVAALVQRMVVGEISGVAFSADPVSGRTDRVLISAAWGLGEGVVSGACDADEIVLDARGRELSARVPPKATRIVPRVGSGTAVARVPEDLQALRCLSPRDARRVAAAAGRIATAFGGPQDVEWTIAGGTLWVLQARPITVLGAPAVGLLPIAEPNERIVWDDSNIQESYAGVTTPLTFSFARAAYASVYGRAMRALGIPERTIATHRPLLENLLGLLRGRIYYRLDAWYRMLFLLPSFGRNKADMEAMMGLSEPVDFVVDESVGPLEKLRRAPRVLATGLRLAYRFARLERDGARFLARFESLRRSIDRAALASAPLPALLAVRDRLQREGIERWEVPILNDLLVMSACGRLRRLVEAAAPDEADALFSELLGGIEGLESAGPARDLEALAARARQDEGLAAILAAGDDAGAWARLRAERPELAAALASWVDRWGDRSAGELKLETRTYRDEPERVVGLLHSFLDRTDLDPARRDAATRTRRRGSEARLAARLGPLARQRLRRTARGARAGIRRREAMRFARTRLFGLVRDVYRAIGARLHEAGRLDDPGHVVWLTVEEIDAAAGTPSASVDLAALASTRRAAFEGYLGETLPHRVVTTGPVAESLAGQCTFSSADRHPSDGRRVLEGLGGSAGVAEGPVLVVRDPARARIPAGRVLVAERTDPGWGPLFPTAAAIVVEHGSALSHAAVLARELGLPAVVGVPGACDLLADGERVRVDGRAGTVTRLGPER